MKTPKHSANSRERNKLSLFSCLKEQRERERERESKIISNSLSNIFLDNKGIIVDFF